MATYIAKECSLFLLVSGLLTSSIDGSPLLLSIEDCVVGRSLVSRSDIGRSAIAGHEANLNRVLRGDIAQETTLVGTSRLLLHRNRSRSGQIVVYSGGLSLQEMDQTSRFTAYLLSITR